MYKSGLGLSEDQIKVLRNAVEEKIDKKLENTRRALEDDAAVDRFQELMRPWETTFASYVARQAPGYASSYVQGKEYNSRAGYQAIWNGTY